LQTTFGISDLEIVGLSHEANWHLSHLSSKKTIFTLFKSVIFKLLTGIVTEVALEDCNSDPKSASKYSQAVKINGLQIIKEITEVKLTSKVIITLK